MYGVSKGGENPFGQGRAQNPAREVALFIDDAGGKAAQLHPGDPRDRAPYAEGWVGKNYQYRGRWRKAADRHGDGCRCE